MVDVVRRVVTAWVFVAGHDEARIQRGAAVKGAQPRFRSAIPVSLDVSFDQRLADSVEVTAYYVLAEARANAAKHAQASEVTVHARTTEDNICLSIHDDGTGGADPAKGSGLIGLKDRVEVIGGHMRVTSPAGQGTWIHVTIPLNGDGRSCEHAAACGLRTRGGGR